MLLIQVMVIAADSLGTFPYRGGPGAASGTRELWSIRPYVLVYRVEAANGVVRILRVWHGAQDRDRQGGQGPLNQEGTDPI